METQCKTYLEKLESSISNVIFFLKKKKKKKKVELLCSLEPYSQRSVTQEINKSFGD